MSSQISAVDQTRWLAFCDSLQAALSSSRVLNDMHRRYCYLELSRRLTGQWVETEGVYDTFTIRLMAHDATRLSDSVADCLRILEEQYGTEQVTQAVAHATRIASRPNALLALLVRQFALVLGVAVALNPCQWARGFVHQDAGILQQVVTTLVREFNPLVVETAYGQISPV